MPQLFSCERHGVPFSWVACSHASFYFLFVSFYFLRHQNLALQSNTLHAQTQKTQANVYIWHPNVQSLTHQSFAFH